MVFTLKVSQKSFNTLHSCTYISYIATTVIYTQNANSSYVAIQYGIYIIETGKLLELTT